MDALTAISLMETSMQVGPARFTRALSVSLGNAREPKKNTRASPLRRPAHACPHGQVFLFHRAEHC